MYKPLSGGDQQEECRPTEHSDPTPTVSQDIPRLDEATYKYRCFEMKNGNVDWNETMKFEGKIMEKLDEQTELESLKRGIGSTSSTRR